MFKYLFIICIWVIGLSYSSGKVTAGNRWFDKTTNLAGGMEKSDSGQRALSIKNIAAGLKDALRVDSETVVLQLGKFDGFNADPAIHIQLPENFRTVRNAKPLSVKIQPNVPPIC